MERYEHQKIEKKWQEKWEEGGVYEIADFQEGRENFYQLFEFPYPSGNLHVGHWYAFAMPDIVARFKRMQGYNVMYPIGFDAFGLPAENAAIGRGVNPREWTYKNMDHMRSQIRSMGGSFDWSREVVTCDPAYYKWTQWLFLRFFKNGLAEHKGVMANWCPSCKTVLANEQVVNGHCERCDTVVEKKQMKQWQMGITKYADRLIDDLDSLDWPEEIKVSQRNWIGRSEGAEISFPLSGEQEPLFSEILIASGNKGKQKRVQMLFDAMGVDIKVRTPEDLGIETPFVSENGTLEENSLAKAQAYEGLTDLPILSNGTALEIDGVNLDPVRVKRNALGEQEEGDITQGEIAQMCHDFYKNLAHEQGGQMDACWRESWTMIYPDGRAVQRESRRDIEITDKKVGEMDLYLPVRCLCQSRTTGKYVAEYTEEDELREMEPITRALKSFVLPHLDVFTTRPDTLYGVTYMAIAPEHGVIADIESRISNIEEVRAYALAAAKKSEIDRTNDTKEKTGVKLEGIAAINPANGEEIPIYVADYVLANYGTGAIMAVPGHDERDYAFAKKYDIPVRQVVAPYIMCGGESASRSDDDIYEFSGSTVIIKHWEKDLYYTINFKHGGCGFVGGHIEEGETPEETAIREVREETGFLNVEIEKKIYETRARGYKERKGREELCSEHVFVARLLDDQKREIDDKEVKDGQWLSSGEIMEKEDFMQFFKGHLKFLESEQDVYLGGGVLIDSEEFNEVDNITAKVAITRSVGGRMTKTYKLRDWTVSRQRYWGAPIPIVHCADCGPQAVPDEQLPVVLPDVEDYLPNDEGRSPLSKADDFVHTTCPACEGDAKRETDTFDTFMCSSWYFLRYCDPQNVDEFADMEQLRKWMAVSHYSGGAEHTTMHLLYSRFFTKALYDMDLVPTSEPYTRRMNRSLILGPDGNKMSKSKGNVIDPDDIVEKLGADTMRLYLAFIGPYNEVSSYPWSPESIIGVRRFVERVWRLQERVEKDGEPSEDVQRELHKTLKKVTESIGGYKLNTGVAALMTMINVFEKQDKITAKAMAHFVTMLAPYAPHIAEEVWENLELGGSPLAESWPQVDEALLASEQIQLIVQVNGKVRAKIETEPGQDDAALEKLAFAHERVQGFVKDKEIRKVIVVRGKLVSIVV